MRWTARRFITKNGNSRTVAIPRPFLEKMRLMRGDAIDVVFDDDELVIRITNAEPRPARANGISAARAARPLF